MNKEKYGTMMIDNVGGMISTMSNICQCLYNQVILKEEYPELTNTFIEIINSEMNHLIKFMELAYKLDIDPRLWSNNEDERCYWSPSFINYPNNIEEIFKTIINNKYQLILKYQKQIKLINDLNITIILEQIIKDNLSHIKILKNWEKKLVRNSN